MFYHALPNVLSWETSADVYLNFEIEEALNKFLESF